ncbi:ABC transporter permease subunit [uncultured Pseudokineococcus sp.]|uniref:ABC transporter permease subunit n=1 Tax=uncultured Pseudokineococcus sp. TaxID=1642928 RepID=UPI0026050F1E|nr:ABC transporter permease subunit [uncultured Pseudokineococcus sp.]
MPSRAPVEHRVLDEGAPRPPVPADPHRARRLLGDLVAPASRVLAIAGVVVLVGLVPWLSRTDPALTVLRGRSAELAATPEALAAVRADLGLDAGPWAFLAGWLADAVRGDFGTSWVSGAPVAAGMVSALGVSLTLMALAAVVAALVAMALVAPTLHGAVHGRPRRPGGALAATLTALPEFLLASVLLVVVAVWLGLLPPYGWQGFSYAVLPAVALGVPAGGLVGLLLADAVAAAATEAWLATWTAAGASRARLAGGLLLRATPGLLPQVGLVLVGLTGGAVAVEQVFAIPGLGRATLGAAATQDLPALQVGVLLLLAVAAVLGVLAQLGRRLVLGAALRASALPAPPAPPPSGRAPWVVPALAALVLLLVIGLGLPGDAYSADRGRLSPPSADLLLGADASGRDLLARLGQGAASTIALALLITAAGCVLGVALGLLPRASTGLVEVTNATPPVIAGILVVAVAGPSAAGAAVAVLAVSWAPLAAHTAALVGEARAQPHVAVLEVLGVGPARRLLLHVLPAVLPPVVRNALIRLPGIALALAALGFLGLGPQPPAPDWGLVLAGGMPYVERAPWVVLAPAASLVALSVLAVTASALRPARRRALPRRAPEEIEQP